MKNLRDEFLQECALAATGGDIVIKDIAEKVKNNQLRVVGHSLYTAKATGGSNNIRMTDASDQKTLGLYNFANAKPAANSLMLVTAVRVLAVTLAAAPTPDTIKGANYGSIKGVDALQNGELDIYSGSSLLMKDFPLSNFVTDNKQSCELGTVMLAAPKFLYPEQEIKIEIRTGINTNTFLVIKVELIGVATQN